jgi:hypothetical protein
MGTPGLCSLWAIDNHRLDRLIGREDATRACFSSPWHALFMSIYGFTSKNRKSSVMAVELASGRQLVPNRPVEPREHPTLLVGITYNSSSLLLRQPS